MKKKNWKVSLLKMLKVILDKKEKDDNSIKSKKSFYTENRKCSNERHIK